MRSNIADCDLLVFTRFRVLVVGNVLRRLLFKISDWLDFCCSQTGVGKSSLINECFGVDLAVSPLHIYFLPTI